ncbi:MAG: hypothetical protein GY795_20500 [Desulfobacterales bacterium]|nr:hypothetical protein [Desulfobacterales bacterium]
MKLTEAKKAVKFSVDFRLRTSLLLRSGKAGEFTDSTIEKTGDGRFLHINGYVWASLLRRALGRGKNTEKMARDIGNYEKPRQEVSPLWCEASFADLFHGSIPGNPGKVTLAIRPGIKVNREWGTTAVGALYTDELVPPGYEITMNFNYFSNDPEGVKKNITGALWIINEGIENIGGGWSYGHGRLEVLRIRTKELDLTSETDRDILWDYEKVTWETDNELEKPEIEKPWKKISFKAEIPEGQLLAVTTAVPPFDITAYPGDNLPDAFVFRQYPAGKTEPEIVIPGKAVRQALLSVPIERRLRTAGERVCLDTTITKGCNCKRCIWFGSVDKRGIVSVADAVVNNSETAVLSRIQLCEHSMQNMNLFSGEFLSQGDFTVDILIDREYETDDCCDELVGLINGLLDEMKPDRNAPPGWYRLGGNSACTGQIRVVAVV